MIKASIIMFLFLVVVSGCTQLEGLATENFDNISLFLTETIKCKPEYIYITQFEWLSNWNNKFISDKMENCQKWCYDEWQLSSFKLVKPEEPVYESSTFDTYLLKCYCDTKDCGEEIFVDEGKG